MDIVESLDRLLKQGCNHHLHMGGGMYKKEQVTCQLYGNGYSCFSMRTCHGRHGGGF